MYTISETAARAFTRENIEKAKMVWICEAQQHMRKDIKKENYKHFKS